ncbi:hypothetical protein PanWU01x14_274770 [Parasponia andersonii]|uniref:HMA domain-containing protein n=1 Tax=Parasponia andersonii TaxID=3476 RepID=A0A2P5B3D9_PARAD|nr:hypothetical protein PanWU01x14_274770 [Parasponia andersonii]
MLASEFVVLMLQQKIVIEVQMKCKKCRSKALKIATAEDGVTSVALKGENKNRMEIIGDGIVDAAGLAETLRKKVGYADLVSVEEVKENDMSQKGRNKSGGDTPVSNMQHELEQKVVIAVTMKCDKCRSKALEIAVAKDGVISVAFKGEMKNQIEIVGEGFIDAAGLAETLRKKQKVVIEVKMKCKKCRSKALEIAVGNKGVISVALKGESKNQIEVIGEGIVDAAGLAEALRKKVGYADLVSVEEVRES